MDLELQESTPAPKKKAPVQPAATPDLEAVEPGDEGDDLDLGEEQPARGLADFDPRIHLDEPGVLPHRALAPLWHTGGGLVQDRGTPDKRWPLWPALVAGGVAVVTLGVGLYLVGIDETGAQCNGDPLPDLRNCAEVYNTADAGYALTAVGVASLATTGLFLYLFLSHGPGEPVEQEGLAGVSVAPDGRGGVVVGASGRFW